MIQLKNINKYYNDKKLHVLKELSLEIQQGEFVSVCGPSGHGKSTLLSLLSLLDEFESGNYLLENIDVSSLSFDERAKVRAKHIGIVFQSFNLIGDYTVKENVSLPLKYASHLNQATHEELVNKALKDVGLVDKKNEYPAALSGGQQQRVAIARSLVTSPSILLADEPTGNLDSKTANSILQLLKELNEKGVTICMITHDMSIAEQTDRVINIYDGKITN